MPNSGIYQITNLVNGKKYIGSSVNILNRFYNHKSALKNNQHRSQILQRAWDKYGEKNFVFLTLFYCDVDLLLFYEQKCLDILCPEYNIAKYAYASMRGRKRPDSSKALIERNKKMIWTTEMREKISASLKGRSIWCTGKNLTEEHKQKISMKLLGRSLPAEQKRKIGDALKGRKFTEEHKKKISEAKKGKPRSEETLKKMSKARIGKHHTEETRKKLSELGKGRKHTNESREKMSKSKKGCIPWNKGKKS